MSAADKQVIIEGLLGSVVEGRTRSQMATPQDLEDVNSPTRPANVFLEVNPEGKPVQIPIPEDKALITFLATRLEKLKKLQYKHQAARDCYRSQKPSNAAIFKKANELYAESHRESLAPLVLTIHNEEERFKEAVKKYAPHELRQQEDPEGKHSSATGGARNKPKNPPPSDPKTGNTSAPSSPNRGANTQWLVQSQQAKIAEMENRIAEMSISNLANSVEVKKYRDAIEVIRYQRGEQAGLSTGNQFYQELGMHPDHEFTPVLNPGGVTLAPVANQADPPERPGFQSPAFAYPQVPRPQPPAPRTSENKISYLVNGLFQGRTSLESLIEDEINDTTPEPVLRELHLSQKTVNEAIDRLERILKAYLNEVPEDRIRESEIGRAQDTLSSAYTWLQKLRKSYRDSGLVGGVTDKDILITPGKFSEDPAVDIFEFLRLFETRYKAKGSPEQKAEKLYREYLIPEHQALFTGVTDYKQLKEDLILAFGQPAKVLASTLKLLDDMKKPTTRREELTRLVTVKKVMTQLLKLKSQNFKESFGPDVSSSSLFSHDVIAKLQTYLKETDQIEFAKQLRVAKLYPDGPAAFKKLLDVVSETAHELSLLLDMNRETKSASKPHRVAAVHVDHEAKAGDESFELTSEMHEEMYYEEDDGYVCAAGQQWKDRDNRKPKPNYPKPPKPERKKSPTCPFQGRSHEHSASMCSELFQNKGYVLRTVLTKERCLVCLGPADACMEACPFIAHFSKDFFCQKCKIKYPVPRPVTFLTCDNEKHFPGKRMEDFIHYLQIILPGVRKDVLLSPVRGKPVFSLNRDQD